MRRRSVRSEGGVARRASDAGSRRGSRRRRLVAIGVAVALPASALTATAASAAPQVSGAAAAPAYHDRVVPVGAAARVAPPAVRADAGALRGAMPYQWPAAAAAVAVVGSS